MVASRCIASLYVIGAQRCHGKAAPVTIGRPSRTPSCARAIVGAPR